MPKKLYMETFGCQMNVLDSELVLGQLRGQGYVPTESREDADVILYNTCSVREHAEMRLFERFPHVDILCGPGELDKLASLVHNAVVTSVASDVAATPASPLHENAGDAGVAATGKQVALMGANVRRSSTLAAAEDNLELLDLSRSISAEDDVRQAYVRITRGCNKFCTYCVVPYTRGPEVHRPPQNIIDEVKRLADVGVREVTLLGQTINHYHFQHSDGHETTFGQLLYQIHEAVPHLPRLRFVTSFPRDFTDEALQAMRDCERICRYLHAPAQHGSNRILKLMNRGYTVEQYREFVERARAHMPDVCIASDFIVGFPTETDDEFQQTVDLLRWARFKNSFIFKYSPRPGTIAIERFSDDVPEDVKRRRNTELLAAQTEVCAANNIEMVGRTVQVLVEGESKLVSRQAVYPKSNVELGWERRGGGAGTTVARTTQMVGRTSGDQVVVFDADQSVKGRLLDVQITAARGMTLFARVLTPVTV
jgi:tRNA-2-methylthio-N6-dimethylallyladenosine synthase